MSCMALQLFQYKRVIANMIILLLYLSISIYIYIYMTHMLNVSRFSQDLTHLWDATGFVPGRHQKEVGSGDDLLLHMGTEAPVATNSPLDGRNGNRQRVELSPFFSMWHLPTGLGPLQHPTWAMRQKPLSSACWANLSADQSFLRRCPSSPAAPQTGA